MIIYEVERVVSFPDFLSLFPKHVRNLLKWKLKDGLGIVCYTNLCMENPCFGNRTAKIIYRGDVEIGNIKQELINTGNMHLSRCPTHFYLK